MMTKAAVRENNEDNACQNISGRRFAIYPCFQYCKGGNYSSHVLATANTTKIADMIKTAAACFDICCFKLKFSSNVTPRFNTEPAVIL